MSDLSFELLGMRLPNPFLLKMGPTGAEAREAITALEAGWGGVILAAATHPERPGEVLRREVIRSGARRWGLVEVGLPTRRSPADLGEELTTVRDSIPQGSILVSLQGDNSERSWREGASVLAEAGADALVIPGGSPTPFSTGEGWAELAGDGRHLANIVSWLRGGTNLPLIVELSPNVTDILPIARAATTAGADGLIATSGLAACGGVDFETLLPLPSGDRERLVGSYTGLGLKPVAQRWTAKLAAQVDVPIIGRGGVAEWQDAAEYFAIGASAVVVGAMAEWSGVEMIEGLRSGLINYLDDKGMRGPEDIRGLALPSIVGFDDLDLDLQMVAVVNEERCTGCEVCVRACSDGGYRAMRMAGAVAQANRSKCDGCGLCVYVCPESAIELVRGSTTAGR